MFKSKIIIGIICLNPKIIIHVLILKFAIGFVFKLLNFKNLFESEI
jgi:hypothetical protein